MFDATLLTQHQHKEFPYQALPSMGFSRQKYWSGGAIVIEFIWLLK